MVGRPCISVENGASKARCNLLFQKNIVRAAEHCAVEMLFPFRQMAGKIDLRKIENVVFDLARQIPRAVKGKAAGAGNAFGERAELFARKRGAGGEYQHVLARLCRGFERGLHAQNGKGTARAQRGGAFRRDRVAGEHRRFERKTRKISVCMEMKTGSHSVLSS